MPIHKTLVPVVQTLRALRGSLTEGASPRLESRIQMPALRTLTTRVLCG